MRPYLKGARATCRLGHGALDIQASYAVQLTRHCTVFGGFGEGAWGV
jgi:hypothetical protein